jgi:predicted permease
MILLNRLRSIVHWILRRKDMERSLDAELRSYIEISTAEKIRDGVSKDEARRRASSELGGIDVAKERVRTERHGALLDSVWRDLRMALRSLAANPRFTIVALLTLVLTIGGITTVFTLVDSVILRPLPYPDSDRLVELSAVELGEKPTVPADADFLDWERRRVAAFDLLGGFTVGGGSFDEGETPRHVGHQGVTREMLPMLGIQPVMGRMLRPDDFKPESPRVILISHALWQSHYGGSPDAIGKTVRITGGTPVEIVGVMPPGFALPGLSGSGWTIWGRAQYDEPPSRDFGSMTVLGRLAPGATMTSARAEMNVVAAALASEYPETNSKRSVAVTPVLDNIVGDSGRVLWLFFAAVTCVLLIGLANLANLQGIRNAQREREMSVRAALGAGRGQLVRQLLTESLVLSLFGGIAGSGVAWAATRALLIAIPSRFPRLEQISVDTNVLLFAIGVSTLAGLSFGLIPALYASRSDLSATLNAGSRSLTFGARQGSTQRVLIALETSLALVLLVGGMLLANSFWKNLTIDSGLNEKNLWSFSVNLPFSSPSRARAYWQSVLQRLRAMPQVEFAALGEGNIFGDNHQQGGVVPEGTEENAPSGLKIEGAYISGDYFPSIGAPIVAGRSIQDTDIQSTQRVAVLNESAAKLFWPGQKALDKKIKLGRSDAVVVGIVRDYQNNDLKLGVLPQMYLSAYQTRTASYGTIFVRTTGGAALAAVIKDTLTGIEKGTAVFTATPDTARWDQLTDQRFRTAVLLTFALAATMLALIGIWGVVSYTVVQRNREVALRTALGATRGETILLMARQALLPAAAGLLLGIIASLWLARLVETYLFNVTPTDPATFVTTSALLGLAAIAASVLPARRAARMDPMTMLRDD